MTSFRSDSGAPPTIPQGWEAGALVSLVLMLLSIGLATLYSASFYQALHDGAGDSAYLWRQVQGVLAGGVLCWVLARLDYHRWRNWAWPILGLSVAALVVVLLPGTEAIAPRINGARRWLRLGFMTIQPSEFAKPAILIWTARMMVLKSDRLHSFRESVLPLLVVWATVLLLIFLEPSLSAAALCGMVAAAVAFVGRVHWRHIVLVLLTALPILFLAIQGEGYRARRLQSFLNPSADVQGAGYQVNQALTAIGSGGALGRGFGQSRMKMGFLPESHNDFAISVLGEEWGFLGLLALVGIYLSLGTIGYRIARDAPDDFGSLLALGMTALLVLPALLHLGINLSLLPPTGVALPFVSYGRSNLIVNFLAVGILVSVAEAGRRHRDALRRMQGEGSPRW